MACGPACTCGCCAGVAVAIPAEPWNPPGLAAPGYRIGTWASFRESAHALLSSERAGTLAALRTRDDDDFTIALLDAWAVVGDVLTFYQERLFAEGRLGTAEEIASLHALARLVGWQPSPGVAAAADVAFTLRTTPDAPRAVTLAPGIKVQSTPGPDEAPAVYETVETIAARPSWNALRPRLFEPQAPTAATRDLWLAGIDAPARPGDGVLFADAATGAPVFATVTRVERLPAEPATDADARDLTRIAIAPVGTVPLNDAGGWPPAGATGVAPPWPPPAPASAYAGETLDAATLASRLETRGDGETAVFAPFEAAPAPAATIGVFRLRAAMFGHAAPAIVSPPGNGAPPLGLALAPGEGVPADLAPTPAGDWADGTLDDLAEDGTTLHLAAVHPEIGDGEAIVLRDGAAWGVYAAGAVTETGYSRFPVAARVTRLALDSGAGFDTLTIRGTTAYADAVWVALAERPVAGDVGGGTLDPIRLEGFAPGLAPGMRVALEGEAPGGGGHRTAEIATLKSVVHAMTYGGGTAIALSPAPTGTYARRTLRINANVAAATHGESVGEILGAGDGARSFHAFAAAQGPQTFTSAATADGVAPTLSIRVDDVLWHPVRDFLDAGPDDRVYTMRIDAEGQTHVRFGDGRTGARLPTGADVRARYRKGLGLAGRVRAGQLDVLMSRPLGLDGARNPLPSSGGADPDGPEDVREAAPLTVRALDRAVSVRDYQDLALGFAGIAKAHAEMRAFGVERRVFVTVAGEAGEPVAPGDALHDKLADALAGAGDPYTRAALASFRPAVFRLGLAVAVHPDHAADTVLTAVEAAFRSAFGFAARRLGEPVWLSEVMAVAHTVPGVVAVDVDKLYRAVLPDGSPGTAKANRGLPADPARVQGPAGFLGAELLTLHPGPLDHLAVMS